MISGQQGKIPHKIRVRPNAVQPIGRVKLYMMQTPFGMGPQDDAVKMISDLCGQAERIVHGAKMTEESSDPDRYALTDLKVDMRLEASKSGDE